ncbi:MAG: carbohydrate ABC transporter permease [Clostridia bacterium]|jgi:ABC transporter, permease protein|nr:carbohydrate ABC transporter permease [Clostridia bacterium]
MKIKYSAGDKVFRIICFIIMGVFALSYIMILINMIFGSFRTTTAFSQKPFNFFDISLNAIKRNYTKAFTYKVGGHTPMPKMILNSLIYVGGIVLLSVTIPAISGYITAKYDFKIKKLITSIVIITLVVPTIGSVTMTYRLMESLHLLNTFQGVFLMSAGGFGFSFLLFRNFFSAIPWEYAEAAFIDGAGDFKVFITIMFPQATPILLSLGVMNFIGCWNDYYTPYLFLNDYPTVAYGLAAITSKYEASVPVVFAALSFSTIVMLVLYMMFSKTIMESMSAGGLKG